MKDPLAPVYPPPLNADPLWCEVRASAAYPSLAVEDVRSVTSSFGVGRFLEASGLKDVLSVNRTAAGVRKGPITAR